ncbi:MAG: TGS domain-containing protein, partial [Candidatus Saccharimonadales bacterium]
DTFKEYDLSNEERIENLRKLFLTAGRDLRAVLINLASRQDQLENISHLPVETQKRAAAETLRLHVPVANRLGLGGAKAALEDQAFALLMPEKFKLMQEKIQAKYEERQQHLVHLIPAFRRLLHREHIAFTDISYRAKSYWSTYQKLVKKEMDFSKIYDLAALRVIVRDVPACYRALGAIHQHYQPIQGEIDDYIARPKPNGYRSLHTAVFLEPGRVSEIQIRTSEMHQEAEYGICAHWQYKENLDRKKQSGWEQEVSGFRNGNKVDFFDNQIFVFTPRGDIISLPRGATPVDFAYAIHSAIGNHCEQAKIDGKIIPLSRELKTGDVVEIITNKRRTPSHDWLRFVKTGFAKSSIKKATVVIITPI